MITTRWTIAVQVGALACALAISAEAAAGTIFGFIRENNQPVAKTRVVLTCDAVAAGTAITDDGGNYRITTARTGRCNVVVGDGRASGDVVLYTEPTQYNFDIKGGRLVRR
jgi:hypothetical protein